MIGDNFRLDSPGYDKIYAMLSRLQFTFLLGITAFFFLLVVSFASAQVLPSSGLNIELSNPYPAPKEEVTISITSFSTDLNSAKVTWTVDGKIYDSGIGKKIIIINAPDMGKTLSIKVSATTNQNITLSETYSLTSGSVDIILETNGFVPPFFRGKLTPVFQNKVKIVAIPHIMDSSGREYRPDELIYSWKKNEKNLSEDSGYGKSALLITGELVPRDTTITVDVQTRDGMRQTSGYLNLEFNEPSIVFYRDDPLFGVITETALGTSFSIGSEREAGIIAMPFGFSDLNAASILWRINNAIEPDLSNKRTLLLRAPEKTSSATMQIEMQNHNNILQSARNVVSAYFKGISTE